MIAVMWQSTCQGLFVLMYVVDMPPCVTEQGKNGQHRTLVLYNELKSTNTKRLWEVTGVGHMLPKVLTSSFASTTSVKFTQ